MRPSEAILILSYLLSLYISLFVGVDRVQNHTLHIGYVIAYRRIWSGQTKYMSKYIPLSVID